MSIYILGVFRDSRSVEYSSRVDYYLLFAIWGPVIDDARQSTYVDAKMILMDCPVLCPDRMGDNDWVWLRLTRSVRERQTSEL